MLRHKEGRRASARLPPLRVATAAAPLLDDVVDGEVDEHVLDRHQVDAVEQDADLTAQPVDATEAARRQDGGLPVGSRLLRRVEQLGCSVEVGDRGVQSVGDRVDQVVHSGRQILEVGRRIGSELTRPQLIEAGGGFQNFGGQDEQAALLMLTEVQVLALFGQRTRRPLTGHLADEEGTGPAEVIGIAKLRTKERHRHVVSKVRVQDCPADTGAVAVNERPRLAIVRTTRLELLLCRMREPAIMPSYATSINIDVHCP